MIESPNGEPKELPAIQVLWDAENQAVGLVFNGGKDGDFKQWAFVIGVLQMAVEKAKEMQQGAAMQAMMAQQQAQSMAQKLRLGH